MKKHILGNGRLNACLQPYLPFKYSPQQKLNKLEPDNSSYQLRNMNYAQWAKFHP